MCYIKSSNYQPNQIESIIIIYIHHFQYTKHRPRWTDFKYHSISLRTSNVGYKVSLIEPPLSTIHSGSSSHHILYRLYL